MRGPPDLHDADTVERADGEAPPHGALRLVVIADDRATARPLPAQGALTIGRARDADVVVEAAAVSRRHATLTIGPRAITITDLGGVNGTSVRGRRLGPLERAPLRPGDAVEIGDAVLVVQRVEDAVDAAPGGAPAPSGMRAAVVVEDERMRALHALLARVARGMINVLLLGETGVGKEVFAEAVHRGSPRRAGPFLRLHCAALSESLLESELFGHRKGAFTGAVDHKVGLLESAAGGTVFLDEVGELPPAAQVKLLRVLEERKVTRVGDTAPTAIDVRVVAATHRDLRGEVARGRFREDLLFRLDGISVTVPPLRERAAEVAPLARLFLGEACARSGIAAVPALAPDALDALRSHPWPGNLRELRNVMERAALLCDGEVRAEHLSFAAPSAAGDAGAAPSAAGDVGPAPSASALRAQLAALERRQIVDALERCGGNQSRAAVALGMPRRTLLSRLDLYGIPRPRADKKAPP